MWIECKGKLISLEHVKLIYFEKEYLIFKFNIEEFFSVSFESTEECKNEFERLKEKIKNSQKDNLFYGKPIY